MSVLITTVVLVFNLVTGYVSSQECPPNAVWQWYDAHSIWACGGER